MSGFDFLAAIHRAEWAEWSRLWLVIGTSEAVRHNLLVLTLSTDIDTRMSAAQEVACVIGALLGRSQ